MKKLILLLLAFSVCKDSLHAQSVDSMIEHIFDMQTKAVLARLLANDSSYGRYAEQLTAITEGIWMHRFYVKSKEVLPVIIIHKK